MQSEEDYIGDLPAHVHSTAFKHKQITKGGKRYLFYTLYIDIKKYTHIKIYIFL